MSRALIWEASLVISPGKDFYEGLDISRRPALHRAAPDSRDRYRCPGSCQGV